MKLSWRRRFKREVGYHGIEITIIMEQYQSFHNTESCDNYINCFSHSNTSSSKESVILGTLNRDIVSTDLVRREETVRRTPFRESFDQNEIAFSNDLI